MGMILYSSNIDAKDGLLARTDLWFSVLRADAVFWSSPLRSQPSADPPTARPDNDNPAVMGYSVAKPDQKTLQLTIADGMNTIEDPKSKPLKHRILEAQ
jgi:hypothetical protein